MFLFSQFAYRLAFGMAAAMLVVSPRLVTSGYFRNNSYVLWGLMAAAAAVTFGNSVDVDRLPTWPAAAAAAAGYVAAALWLYEKPRAARAALAVVSFCALGGVLTTVRTADRPPSAVWLGYGDAVAGGLLLGLTMAAMLLGHWYLNAPGMKIRPLQQLALLIAAAVVMRSIVSGVGLAAEWSVSFREPAERLMLALRWLAGVFGTGLLIGMTWTTLKIPNTQAATGMLYVAVITTFLGELVGQLLSVGSVYPL